MKVPDHAIEVVRWIDQFGHFSVAFQKPCVILIKKGCDETDKADTSGYGDQTVQRFFSERVVFDCGENKCNGRQNAEKENMKQGTDRDQIKCFSCIGFEDIPDHIGIDKDTQFGHEVTGATGDQKQDDQYRFDGVSAEQVQKQEYGGEYEYRHADGEQKRVQTGNFRMGNEIAP